MTDSVRDSFSSLLSRRRGVAVVVALVALAVYANSLWNGFAFDDEWIIVMNVRVHQLDNLEVIWGTPYWPIMGTVYGLYRPLTIFGYAVQWVLTDGSPWLFHLVNVLLHAGVSVLVFLLLDRLVRRWAAVAGAVLFAVHPVHTEAVANVVGQAELLAAAAVVGAAVLYVGRPEGQEVRLPRLLGIAVLYAVGMLAKEHAVVLPGLLVLLDFAERRVRLSPEDLRRYLVAAAPAFALLAAVLVAYLAVRVDVLGSVSGTDAAPHLPYLREEGRRLTALRAWPEWVRLLFYPVDLSADYSPGVILPVKSLTPMAALGGFLLLGTVALALALPVHPGVGLPAAWFLVTILPVSNLIVPIGTLVAERALYLPSVAIAFVGGYGLVALRERLAGGAWRGTVVAVACVLLLMGARTVVRNPDWRSTDAVLDSLIRDHPESYRAQWNAAVRALPAGDTARAARHWALAYRMWSRDSQFLTNLGAFLLQVERYHDAVEVLETAHRMHPRMPNTAELRALAYLGAGFYEDALDAAETAIRVAGPQGALFDLRARALAKLGRPEEAVGSWRVAVRRGAGGRVQWMLLGQALARTGAYPEALAALDSARALAGDDSTALAEVDRVAGVVRDLRAGREVADPGASAAAALEDLVEDAGRRAAPDSAGSGSPPPS